LLPSPSELNDASILLGSTNANGSRQLLKCVYHVIAWTIYADSHTYCPSTKPISAIRLPIGKMKRILKLSKSLTFRNYLGREG